MSPRDGTSCSLTNLSIIERLKELDDKVVYGYISTTGGPVLVAHPKRLIKALLEEAGRRNPAICRFYIRDLKGYVCPIHRPVPSKEWRQLKE